MSGPPYRIAFPYEGTSRYPRGLNAENYMAKYFPVELQASLQEEEESTRLMSCSMTYQVNMKLWNTRDALVASSECMHVHYYPERSKSDCRQTPTTLWIRSDTISLPPTRQNRLPALRCTSSSRYYP